MRAHVLTIQIKNKIYLKSFMYFTKTSVSFPKIQPLLFVGIILFVKQIVYGIRDGKW